MRAPGNGVVRLASVSISSLVIKEPIPECRIDGGAPMSTCTVAREMGHGGEAMVRKVYGHLGQVRHRSEAVEYRIEQHVAKLEARLKGLRGVAVGTTVGTTA